MTIESVLRAAVQLLDQRDDIVGRSLACETQDAASFL